jgi:hypothetical protein
LNCPQSPCHPRVGHVVLVVPGAPIHRRTLRSLTTHRRHNFDHWTR